MSGESAPIPWNFDDKRVGWTLATAYAVVSGAGHGWQLVVLRGECPHPRSKNDCAAMEDCEGTPAQKYASRTAWKKLWVCCAAACSKKKKHKKAGDCIAVYVTKTKPEDAS